jgi:hypothetical protein
MVGPAQPAHHAVVGTGRQAAVEGNGTKTDIALAEKAGVVIRHALMAGFNLAHLGLFHGPFAGGTDRLLPGPRLPVFNEGAESLKDKMGVRRTTGQIEIDVDDLIDRGNQFFQAGDLRIGQEIGLRGGLRR